MKNSRRKFCRLIAAMLILLPSAALAHAFLDHADPNVGSTVDKTPSEIRIWFTEDIEPAFSTLEVRDSKGNQIDRKDTHQDSKDKTLLIVSVPTLADGDFKIIWSVVATDTHHTHGDFKFTVKTKN